MVTDVSGIGLRDGLFYTYQITARSSGGGRQEVRSVVGGSLYLRSCKDPLHALASVRRDITALLEDVHGATGRSIDVVDQSIPELREEHKLRQVLYVRTRMSAARYGKWLMEQLQRDQRAAHILVPR